MRVCLRLSPPPTTIPGVEASVVGMRFIPPIVVSIERDPVPVDRRVPYLLFGFAVVVLTSCPSDWSLTDLTLASCINCKCTTGGGRVLGTNSEGAAIDFVSCADRIQFSNVSAGV